jgi:hypothetical protein
MLKLGVKIDEKLGLKLFKLSLPMAQHFRQFIATQFYTFDRFFKINIGESGQCVKTKFSIKIKI